MWIYMFHYVKENKFNYYHFNKYDFEESIIKLLNSGKKIISFDKFKQIVRNDYADSDNSVLLTFDDGLRDHYDTVYPVLKKYNLTGLFFVCSNILENRILDINLIHHIIANSQNEDLFSNFQKLLSENNVTNNYYNELISTRYDDKKILYFKQMLQFILPNDVKNKILHKLVSIYNVSLNFRDYYMDIEQIKEMKGNGMEFGLHTANHKRLEKLSYDEQFKEIIQSMRALNKENITNYESPLSYPFGSYNSDTIKILKKAKIKYAFCINAREFTKRSDLLTIPRYDCNVLKEIFDYGK